MRDEPLAQCPTNKRNCVCSVDQSTRFNIAPLTGYGQSTEAFRTLKALIKREKRYVVVSETSTYLHAEYRTRWLRFTDDLEFQLMPKEDLIHVRSASRVGYSDLGANRRRIEALRKTLDKLLSPKNQEFPN